MQIIAQCPSCRHCWLLEPEAADRRIKCPVCERLFKVPPLERVPKAVQVINQTSGKVFVDQNGNIYG